MSKTDKVLEKILRGQADSNIDFDEVCHLLRHLGFAERTRGSHHVFKKPNVPAIVLQADTAHAKSYQIRQIRQILKQFKIGGAA